MKNVWLWNRVCLETIPYQGAGGGHYDAVCGEGHGVVAHQHEVGVARAAPRRAHLVQDAGVVLAVRQSQQALAHHSSTKQQN